MMRIPHALRIGAVLVMCLVAGCGDDPLSIDEERDLARAMARWEREGSEDYTVEARISCFCSPHLLYWTRLTVQNGVLVAAEPVEELPDGYDGGNPLAGWLTVTQMFAAATDTPDIVKDVRVRFDAALGYPTRVETICDDNVADCGTVREMRDLRITAAR
jgi:hypothetical protein